MASLLIIQMKAPYMALMYNRDLYVQYNTIQDKTYNAPYVTRMLFVGAEICDYTHYLHDSSL